MRIVVLHAGGLGDLILVETLLSGLRERYPTSHLTLVCHEDGAPVASLYDRGPDAVIPFAFNPYRWALPTSEVAASIGPLLHTLAGDPVDLFISAELRATLLSDVLAAALSPGDAVIADPRTTRRATTDVAILLRHLGLSVNRNVRNLPEVRNEHELDRYARLGGVERRRLPALRVAENADASDAPLVVFPLGTPAIKRWPLRSIADAATRISRDLSAPIALVGSDSERTELEAAVHQGLFDDRTVVVTGTPAELPRVAEAIARARGYLGIDTGLAHLATAFGVPGVTVFGGGTWPAYAPWRSTSAAVVAPIPCFGCDWDCAFDRAFCIEPIDVQSVVSAFEEVAGPDRDEPLVVQLQPYNERESAIFRAAAAVHRASASDRSARLSAITRVRDILNRYVGQTRKRDLAKGEALQRVVAAARAASAARRKRTD